MRSKLLESGALLLVPESAAESESLSKFGGSVSSGLGVFSMPSAVDGDTPTLMIGHPDFIDGARVGFTAIRELLDKVKPDDDKPEGFSSGGSGGR